VRTIHYFPDDHDSTFCVCRFVNWDVPPLPAVKRDLENLSAAHKPQVEGGGLTGIFDQVWAGMTLS
jgi:hypothetical protein